MPVTPTNGTKYGNATPVNASKHGRFGDYTMAQLANTTVSQWALTTFDSITIIPVNGTKHGNSTPINGTQH